MPLACWRRTVTVASRAQREYTAVRAPPGPGPTAASKGTARWATGRAAAGPPAALDIKAKCPVAGSRWLQTRLPAYPLSGVGASTVATTPSAAAAAGNAAAATSIDTSTRRMHSLQPPRSTEVSASSAARSARRAPRLLLERVDQLLLAHAGAPFDAGPLGILVQGRLRLAGVDAAVRAAAAPRCLAALRGLRVRGPLLRLRLPVVALLLGHVLDGRPRRAMRALFAAVLLVRVVEGLLVGLLDLLGRALQRAGKLLLAGGHDEPPSCVSDRRFTPTRTA